MIDLGPIVCLIGSSLDGLLMIRANEKGSLVYKLQKNFQNIFGFTLPLFYGRG
jgi:hypothetical protein